MNENNEKEMPIMDAMINEINMLRMASFTLADTISRILIEKKIVTEAEWLTYLSDSRQNVACQLIYEATNAAAQNPNLVEKEGPVQEDDYVEVETMITGTDSDPEAEETIIKKFKSIFKVSDDQQVKEQIIGQDKGFTFSIKPTNSNSSNNMYITILRVLTLKD